jgi:hypothetical protein
MRTNPRNLLMKVVRGRAETFVFNFRNSAGLGYDITTWWFSMSVRKNYSYSGAPVSFTMNPIVNDGDPTAGILMWTIWATTTDLLIPGSYVFDMSVVNNPIDKQPRFLCGGTFTLEDNVTSSVATPP